MDLEDLQSLQRISFPRALRNTAGGGISQNGYERHGTVQQRQDSNPPRPYCGSVSPPRASLLPVTPARGGWSGCDRTSVSSQQPWVLSTFQFLFKPSFLPQHEPWLLWGCVIFHHAGYALHSLSWPVWSSVGGNLSSWWAGPSQVSCICFKTRIRRVLFLTVFSICFSTPTPPTALAPTKMEQRMLLLWGINFSFPVKYKNTAGVHFFHTQYKPGFVKPEQ